MNVGHLNVNRVAVTTFVLTLFRNGHLDLDVYFTALEQATQLPDAPGGPVNEARTWERLATSKLYSAA